MGVLGSGADGGDRTGRDPRLGSGLSLMLFLCLSQKGWASRDVVTPRGVSGERGLWGMGRRAYRVPTLAETVDALRWLRESSPCLTGVLQAQSLPVSWLKHEPLGDIGTSLEEEASRHLW